MRPAWTKFSRCTSLAVALGLSAWMLAGAGAAVAQNSDGSRRANEVTLAGLRPGHDTLATALTHYKAKYLTADSPGEKRWRDTCTGRELVIEIDKHEVIQEITVSALAPRDGKCTDRRFDTLDMQDWFTGHGLSLGDAHNRITEMYGEPNSSGPSVRGATELEYLYYSFDFAGEGVPQVMEIYCARDTGRVLEITLAFPSL